MDQDPSLPDPPEKRTTSPSDRSRWLWWIGIGGALLVVLYAPSIFVVAYILEKGFGVTSPPTWLRTFYSPIFWLMEHVQWFEDVMTWIARLIGL